MSDAESPLIFTDSAANKVKTLIQEEGNDNLKLRVYVTGGGCSGFQYGFTFDESINDGDTAVENNGVTLLIDPMSYQYMVGAEIDYKEDLEGAQSECNHYLWLRFLFFTVGFNRHSVVRNQRPWWLHQGRFSLSANKVRA